MDRDAKTLADGVENVPAVGGGNLLSAGATGVLAIDRDDMPSSVDRLIFGGGPDGEMSLGRAASHDVSIGGAIFIGGTMCDGGEIFAGGSMFC